MTTPLERFASCKPMAFKYAGRFFSRHEQELRAAGYERADVIQRTLMALDRASRLYVAGHPGGARFSTYAARSIWNELLVLQNEIRRKRIMPFYGEPEGGLAWLPAPEADPAAQAEGLELQVKVENALRCLDRRRRLVVVRHARGVTLTEIGVELGITRQAAMLLWASSLTRLRRALADAGG